MYVSTQVITMFVLLQGPIGTTLRYIRFIHLNSFQIGVCVATCYIINEGCTVLWTYVNVMTRSWINIIKIKFTNSAWSLVNSHNYHSLQVTVWVSPLAILVSPTLDYNIYGWMGSWWLQPSLQNLFTVTGNNTCLPQTHNTRLYRALPYKCWSNICHVHVVLSTLYRDKVVTEQEVEGWNQLHGLGTDELRFSTQSRRMLCGE